MRKKFGHTGRMLCVLLATSLLTACGEEGVGVYQPAPELIEPVNVASEEVRVERRNVYTFSSYESAVLPKIQELTFEASGKIQDMNVVMGQKVKAGDVLAELDNSAEAQYKNLLEQLEKSRENNRYNNRLSEIAIEIAELSGQDTEWSKMQLRQKKEMQELEERHLLSQIEKAEIARGETRIVAANDGTIVGVAAEEGSTVSETTPVIAFADESECYLTCSYINAKTIASCERYYAVINGKEYDLEYIPYSEEELEAKKVSGDTLISTFRLKADKDVRIGDYALVCVVSDYRENVVAVPRTALYKERGKYYVYVVEGENRIQTQVTLGVFGSMYAEVLEGVEEGAYIYVKE